jgi:hypothetical protein
MLYLLLAYPVISAICLWVGWLFYQVLPIRLITPTPDSPLSVHTLYGAGPLSVHTPIPYTRPAILYLFTGLMLLTGIGQWIILFAPLDNTALLLILLGLTLLTGLLFLLRPTRLTRPAFLTRPPALSGRQLLLFIACACALLGMILVLNAGPTIMDDTDSYHIQMVKWIREYGTVPGIANLHLRFGFNSSWFTAIALLSPRVTGAGQYLVLNGLLSCWFCLYLLQKIMTGNAAAAILLAIGLLVWPMIRGNAASANYDFITTCCTLVLLTESIDPRRPGLWPEWLLWPCFLFTVRIVNTPLLLFPIVAGIAWFRQNRTIPWISTVFAAFFFIPFLARNVLLSGYLLFPFYQLDLFSVDWKADRQELIQITGFIKYFNRSNGNIEEVRYLSFPRWLPVWFRHLFIYDKMIVGLALLGWALIGWQWKKSIGRYTPICKGLILALAINIVCWLLTAPDPRFLYGALLAGPFLFLLFFPLRIHSLASLPASRLTTAFLLCLTISVFGYTARKVQTNPGYQNPITPHPLPTPVFTQIQVDGITVRIPEKVLNNWNPRCYDLPLPCLYRVNPRLHSRGKDIRDGFRLEGPARGKNPLLPAGPEDPQEDNGEFKLE